MPWQRRSKQHLDRYRVIAGITFAVIAGVLLAALLLAWNESEDIFTLLFQGKS